MKAIWIPYFLLLNLYKFEGLFIFSQFKRHKRSHVGFIISCKILDEIVKNGERFYFSCNYSWRLYFLMKMKEVKLKYHHTSACLNLKLWYNKTETIKVTFANHGMKFIKTFDQYLFKFNSGHIFSSIVLPLSAGEK